MAILATLRKFIDGNQHRLEEQERRRQREALPPDFDPELIEQAPPLKAKEAPLLHCRICAFEGTGKFCPTCLAETMV